MGSCNYTIKCFFFFWFLLCALSTSMTITSSSSSLVNDNAYIVYMEREKGAQQAHYHDYHSNQLHELLGSKEAAREAFLYSKHTIYGFAAKLTEPQAKKMAAGTRTLIGSVTNDAPASPGIEGLTPCEIADRYYSYCQKRYYVVDKFCKIVFDNYNICHGLVDVPTQPGPGPRPPPPRHP